MHILHVLQLWDFPITHVLVFGRGTSWHSGPDYSHGLRGTLKTACVAKPIHTALSLAQTWVFYQEEPITFELMKGMMG